MRLSVIVLTRNDEDLIKSCLESVKWADEIIVVDNESVDRTLEIVKKYTEKILVVKELDFALVRSQAMEKASGEWVLYVDSDERVLEPLKEEILQLIQSDKFGAYAVSRRNIIFGQEKKYGPFWPDWVIRLVKRDSYIGWVGEVHEYMKFKGELGYTKNSFLHLTHRNIDQVVLKSLHWSNIDARLRLNAHHPPMSGWRFLRIFISEIFEQGIIRRGFFNGSVGVIDSLLQAFSLYITYVRLWQLQQKLPLDEVYKKLDQKLLESDFKSY